MPDAPSGASSKVRLRIIDAFLDGASCVRRWASADAIGARSIASLTNLLSRLDVLTLAAGGVDDGVSPWLYNATPSLSSSSAASAALLLGPLSGFYGLAPRLALVHLDEVSRARALLCGGVLDVLRDEEAGLARASALALATLAKATPAVRDAADVMSVESPVRVSELMFLLERLSAAIAMRTGRRIFAALQTAADVDVGKMVGITPSTTSSSATEAVGDDDDAITTTHAATAAARVATTAQIWAADALECDQVGILVDFSDLLWRLEGKTLFTT